MVSQQILTTVKTPIVVDIVQTTLNHIPFFFTTISKITKEIFVKI